MAVLCRLSNPSQYVACQWDLIADEPARRYWLDHFARHSQTVVSLIRQQLGGDAEPRIEAFQRDLAALLGRMERQPHSFGELTILTLDEQREALLRRHGFDDPFAQIKRREDEAALAQYPRLLEDLQLYHGKQLLERLVCGVFAGNVFDLGSIATMRAYQGGGFDFFATRAAQRPRPWLVDDFDSLAERLDGHRRPYRQALFFVDNAGPDLILGCLPLARQLGLWGTRVVLAANSRPSLNDVTAAELQAVLRQVRQMDRVVADLLDARHLSVVPSGCSTPLIDLSRISQACNEAARQSDLIILEGMGRSVESNYEARFDCDCLKLALLKDPAVAERLGGRVFDAVCKFEPARR
ncbi:MAG: ARMT1-like domain-containing protein [Phycisphaerae bacterium]